MRLERRTAAEDKAYWREVERKREFWMYLIGMAAAMLAISYCGITFGWRLAVACGVAGAGMGLMGYVVGINEGRDD